MHKRAIFSVFMALCMVGFGASATNNRRSGAVSQPASNGTAAVSRSATRSPASAVNVAPVASARSAKVQNVVKNNVSARAAATTKQKVVNTGVKIASATSNTVVSEECQDAFYGCMDSFCMLDNTSGGRCQCSDRNAELNLALEEIIKLDEQSYIMATEGVERLMMGDKEEEIIARAKAAADKVVSGEKESKNSETKKKVKQLDLSAWGNNNFYASNSDIFGDDEEDDASPELLASTFANKAGDDLYISAAGICVKQLPTQCYDSSAMLQLVYSQKIKSDCMAYENSLKQQKIASTQKLQTAEKALRDTALEIVEDENKYDKGQCILELKKCIQEDGGCGEDFTGCVTLAAAENVQNNVGGTISKKKKISGTSVMISMSTMDTLSVKRQICEERVVKHCVAYKDSVWDLMMQDIAPALAAAESVAEDSLRRECTTKVVECFRDVCGKVNLTGTEEDQNYDACLSQPELYKALCKVTLEPCLAATGGTYDAAESSYLWQGIKAALASMRVDACTAEVKACLLSEDRCGDDYTGCIGLSTDQIVDLCPPQKLTACQDKYKTDTVRAYVAEIAQGLALGIDNTLLQSCQKAVNTAMVKVCGDTESCTGFSYDINIGALPLSYKVCKEGSTNDSDCKESVDLITEKDLGLDELITMTEAAKQSEILTFIAMFKDGYVASKNNNGSLYAPVISGELNWGTDIDINDTDEIKFVSNKENDAVLQNIVDSMNLSLRRVMNTIEMDPKVDACMNGKSYQQISADGNYSETTKIARFKNLTNSLRQIIANSLYNKSMNEYYNKLNELRDKADEDRAEIMKKYADVLLKNDEMKRDEVSSSLCDGYNTTENTPVSRRSVVAVYNKDTNVCTKTTTTQNCEDDALSYVWSPGGPTSVCSKWKDSVDTVTQIQM